MVNLNKLARKKLGEILVEEGLLTTDQIDEALKRQKDTADLLGECLTKMGFVTEIDIAGALAKQFGLPYIDVNAYQVAKDIVSLIPGETMIKNQFILLDKIGKVLIVAVAGTIDPAVFNEVEKQTGSQVSLYVSTASQVMGALRKHVKGPTEQQ